MDTTVVGSRVCPTGHHLGRLWDVMNRIAPWQFWDVLKRTTVADSGVYVSAAVASAGSRSRHSGLPTHGGGAETIIEPQGVLDLGSRTEIASHGCVSCEFITMAVFVNSATVGHPDGLQVLWKLERSVLGSCGLCRCVCASTGLGLALSGLHGRCRRTPAVLLEPAFSGSEPVAL